MEANAPFLDGARHQGMEHWLPLFHDTLETLFDHCEGALYIADDQTEAALQERHEQIADYYQARHEAMQSDMKDSDGRRIIKPLPPEALYLLDSEWAQRVNDIRWRSIGAFEHPDGENLSGPRGFLHRGVQTLQCCASVYRSRVAPILNQVDKAPQAAKV